MIEQPSLFAVKPIITYPREAQVGKTYLMTIDLQPEEGFKWQYEEEEYPVYCKVDSEIFSSKPIGEPVVVLHRFGGNYGEAKFLLTAALEAGQGDISIILINAWGVPLKVVGLEQIQLLPTEIIHLETELFIEREARETVSAISKVEEEEQKINETATACAIIFTSLPIEYLAVRSYLTEIREETSPQGAIYERGKFAANNKIWNVGIVEIGVGNTSSALEAERAIAYFNPDAILFAGIAEGIKDVCLGDVVVSTKVYGYESGKVEETFRPRPEIKLNSNDLVQLARAEVRKADWLQRLASAPSPPPKVFVAPIVAGEKVVASKKSEVFKFLQETYRDAVAVEMEEFSFLSVARANQQVPALVIRGISDLIDNKTGADNQGYQEIAARHASAFAFELLAKFKVTITPKKLNSILDRLVKSEHTDADIATLRQVLNDIFSDVTLDQHQLALQLSKYNVKIGEGKELRIGDRTFREVNDETMKALTRTLPSLNQFNSLIEDKTKWFVGRTYVFDAIQSFIRNNPKGYFTIIGDPGQGKSAILAKYVQNTGCVAHFNLQLQGINRADQFLESICRQLVIRYDLAYDPLPGNTTQDGEFLSQLLEEVARKADGQPVVIAVDALDEVNLANYRDANILYLPPQLPDGIYFILTRRRVEVPLTVYVPTRSLSLLDEQYQADSERDVRTYVQNHIDDSNTLRQRIDERHESVPDFINKLTEKSEMNFMYLRYILQDIESGLYRDLDLERFPHGLQGYYEFHWRRMGMMNQPLPTEKIKIVYILAEVRQPVSARKIADLSGEDLIRVEQVILEWRQFLHVLYEDYDLNLMLLNSVNEIPTKGRLLVNVAKIENFYHVRIFDKNGNKVIDKGKDEFLPNEALIQQLELALNNRSVGPQTKNELIQEITSALEYAPNEQIRYSIYNSSFRDFLHRQDILASHSITLQDVHRRIAEAHLSFWERFKTVKGTEKRETIPSRLDYLQRLADGISPNESSIKSAIESELENSLLGKKVESYEIPDDNNEATVEAIEEIQTIDLNVSGIEYVNDEKLLIPFELQVECLLQYLVFKADYYILDDDRNISIDDWDDHYFMAEESYPIEVEGIVAIIPNLEDLEFSGLSDDDVMDLLEDAEISIESLTRIEVISR